MLSGGDQIDPVKKVSHRILVMECSMVRFSFSGGSLWLLHGNIHLIMR